MAKQIKDALRSLTDSFRKVNNPSSEQLKNMEAVAKAAKKAAKEAKNGTA